MKCAHHPVKGFESVSYGSIQALSTQEVELTHQPVELFKVLKIGGVAGSGGQAKMLIADGAVTVNGDVETRKRRKIHHGDLIVFEDEQLQVVCVNSDTDAQPSVTSESA